MQKSACTAEISTKDPDGLLLMFTLHSRRGCARRAYSSLSSRPSGFLIKHFSARTQTYVKLALFKRSFKILVFYVLNASSSI